MSPGPAPADRTDAALVVEGVQVRLAGRQVLRDVSLRIEPGEFSGLIGSNGAGKTTLLRVVLGLQPYSAGRVELPVGGSSVPAKSRRPPAVGYVPQKVVLDADLPLRTRDLVALGLDGHRLGVPIRRRRRWQEVEEVLEAVGATHLADARVGTLSGGEQQRVLVAHALISRPRLLLLDEPLAGLDLGAVQEVVELLGRLSRRQNVAVLLSAHDMNPLLPVMDRIVYLAEGRTASGTVDEVVRSEVLSALYGHHVDVLRVHGRVIVVAGPAHAPLGASPDHLEGPGEPGVAPIT